MNNITMVDYSKHFWHPMLHPNEMKLREPTHTISADGVHIRDGTGKELLDAVAGLWCVNVGHNRPEMKRAIIKQLDELEHVQLFDGVSHPRATEMAARLVGLTRQENMKRVFFTTGGSDSVETALKLARQYHIINGEPGRQKFISLKNACHGTHFGAASVTGINMYRRNYEPLLNGVIHVDAPWPYRNPWHCEDPETLAQLCAEQLAREIEHQVPDTVAAFIAEPVMGAGGVIVPPEKYWPLVREVCDRYDVLLIADEVVTGFGRTGNMFGSRGWKVAADMMCLAKGLSSGYIPLGAVMINERMERAWDGNIDFTGAIMTGCTYAGHPVACAAGLASLDIIERENLPENAAVQGEYLLDKLRHFAKKFRSVGDVRGKGLMLAMDLVIDKKTREPVEPGNGFVTCLAAAVRRQGALVRPLGSKILLSPPLVFQREHCDQLVEALDKAFTEVDSLCVFQ